MTANATPNNRRPIRWWYLPTLVVTLFMGFAALTGASMAAAPFDVPGKAAPAGRTQPDACGPGANYVIATGTTTLTASPVRRSARIWQHAAIIHSPG